MVVKQIYNTDNKNQILINLPDSFKRKKRILVVIDDSVDNKADKMELMKIASKDPLFLADIDSISKDFDKVDTEIQ
jgi:hypothetical protein